MPSIYTVLYEIALISHINCLFKNHHVSISRKPFEQFAQKAVVDSDA
jgi:hypothetical protein